MNAASERWSEQRSEEVAGLLVELGQQAPGSQEHRAIRDRLVEVHLPLLHYLANRFAGRTESREDLVQVGVIGLLKAIDRFDPTMGHRFATYAAPTIVGEMKRHLRDTGWLVRVPRRAQELHASVVRAREQLSQSTGREPSMSEIAEQVDATPEEVAETLDVARARSAAPLDPLLDGSDAPSVQRLVAEVDDGFEQVERRAALKDALAALTPQEQHVIQLRFGDGKTQAQIGAALGVSQMQVSRILTRSVAKMRAGVDVEGADV